MKKNNFKCYICGNNIHEANLTYKDGNPCHYICLKKSPKTFKDIKNDKKSIIGELSKQGFHLVILRMGITIIIFMSSAMIGFIFGSNLGQQIVKFFGG